MQIKFDVTMRDLLYIWKRCVEESSSDVDCGRISSVCINNKSEYRLAVDTMNGTINRLIEVRDAIAKMYEDRNREDDEDDKWI